MTSLGSRQSLVGIQVASLPPILPGFAAILCYNRVKQPANIQSDREFRRDRHWTLTVGCRLHISPRKEFQDAHLYEPPPSATLLDRNIPPQ